jgi:hypothetical protein
MNLSRSSRISIQPTNFFSSPPNGFTRASCSVSTIESDDPGGYHTLYPSAYLSLFRFLLHKHRINFLQFRLYSVPTLSVTFLLTDLLISLSFQR